MLEKELQNTRSRELAVKLYDKWVRDRQKRADLKPGDGVKTVKELEPIAKKNFETQVVGPREGHLEDRAASSGGGLFRPEADCTICRWRRGCAMSASAFYHWPTPSPHSRLVIAAFILLLCSGAASGQARSVPNGRLSHRGLTPAADSEVRLSEVTFTTDGAGRLKVYLSGEMKKKELTRIFWVIDPRTHTYSALRLTGNDAADANRVARLLQERGQAVSEAAIGIHLTEERTSAEAKQRRMKDAKEGRGNRDEFAINLPCPTARNTEPVSQHGPSVDEGGQWSQDCIGWGWASIQTWELAIQYGFTNEYLNETYLETDWVHYRYWWGQDFWVYDAYGSCWANPATFFNTHWYIASCLPIATTINGAYFDQQKTGSYVNADFTLAICAATGGLFCPWPFPALARTTTTAAVQYANGQANWGTSFNIDTDYRAYTWLLEHVFLVGTASGGADEPAAWCEWFCDPDPDDVWECEHQEAPGYWDYDTCECVGGASPIVIDLERDGFSFTNVNDGVQFDILSQGSPVQVAWTTAGSRDAFLTLDRNHNGFIDDSSELFGNFTPGAGGDKNRGPNGFAALSEFDLPKNGGNGDGQIAADDQIFTSLRLWTDSNHDGISQPSELTTLQEAGVVAISLQYAAASHRDEFGNILRFKAIVTMDRDALDYGLPKRTAVDVFFAYWRN
jgi:hypothetical protein